MRLGLALGILSALLALQAANASRGGRSIACPLGAPTRVVAAAFTPSGNRLAYARGNAIYVTTLSGRVVARRDASAIPAQMAWQPQGSALAYVSGNELHLVEGGDRILFRAPATLELGGWMPDGTSLVVSTTDVGPTATTTPETYLVSAGDTAVQDLGAGTDATPSPDGTRVAVVAPNQAEIQVIDLASGTRKTIFETPAPLLVISALDWSPDSRQVAFLWHFDVAPSLIAQNADGSSSGPFGREHGALPTQIGMTDAFAAARPFRPFRWTTRGIIGEAPLPDNGSFIAFYDAITGKERGAGVYPYVAAFLAASSDGAHAVYNATGPENTLAHAALRIADWPGTDDRPFLPCNGTARADRIRTSAEPTTIHAGGGNDVVFARNHQRDLIDCGSGIDTAYVDRRDVTRRCEHVHRARG
jgi:hypothetical protein